MCVGFGLVFFFFFSVLVTRKFLGLLCCCCCCFFWFFCFVVLSCPELGTQSECMALWQSQGIPPLSPESSAGFDNSFIKLVMS